jgi:hypothetical protein
MCGLLTHISRYWNYMRFIRPTRPFVWKGRLGRVALVIELTFSVAFLFCVERPLLFLAFVFTSIVQVYLLVYYS